ncbi:MAG: tetratricopeptide repeat protein [Candidatus Eisenbacteria bacterium]|nr:tetratricopeptide repeat protein [Candidatus Eisenbacteria bacterium]
MEPREPNSSGQVILRSKKRSRLSSRISTLLRRGLMPALFFAGAFTGRGAAQEPGTVLETARRDYYSTDFHKALQHVDTYLSQQDLLPAERIAGLQLKGMCHIALRDSTGARRTIEAILEEDPSYRVDPDVVPPGLLRVYYRVLRDRGELSIPEGIRSVAVLYLTNSSVTEHEQMDPLRQGLADAIITDITGATDVRVVERERLEYIRTEIMRQQTVEFDQTTAVRAGRLLGAQSFLFGSFTRIGDELRLNARLVETETGEILKAHLVEGEMDEIFDLVHQLSRHAVEDLGALYNRPLSQQDADLKAFLEYAEGLTYLDRGDYDEARAHFEKALEYSPDYAKAERRYRQVLPLMAMGEEN